MTAPGVERIHESKKEATMVGTQMVARSIELPAKLSTRAVATLAGALLVLLAVVFALQYAQTIGDWLKPERLVTLFQSAGPLGPLILIGCMILAVVVSPIPSFPIDLAAGAAYGPIWGAIYCVIGALIGAVISFFIARALGRELLQKLLRSNIQFCEACSDAHLVILLVLARLIPVFSFDVVSYGAGLTNISATTFSLATLAGMIPPTFAFTYFGSSVVSAQWVLIMAGAIMVRVFMLTPKLVLRYPNAWWAKIFLAAGPGASATPITSSPSSLICSGCGRVLG